MGEVSEEVPGSQVWGDKLAIGAPAGMEEFFFLLLSSFSSVISSLTTEKPLGTMKSRKAGLPFSKCEQKGGESWDELILKSWWASWPEATHLIYKLHMTVAPETVRCISFKLKIVLVINLPVQPTEFSFTQKEHLKLPVFFFIIKFQFLPKSTLTQWVKKPKLKENPIAHFF